ncbi:MAG: response regulator transcription factor [Ktedonobacterales bacterium]
MRILVVDDDAISGRMLQFLLSEQGYQVEIVDNARGALALVERTPPDLMLLDVNLPQLNGFDLYQRLREQSYDLPVIFVTAKGELEDRLQGLRMGADDYICKPFQPAELAARVEAVLRRYHKTHNGDQQISTGELGVDVPTLQVTLPDRRTVRLTPTEMKLLLQLVQRPGQTISREDLLDAVWGEHYIGESNIVDVYVRRLRRKIERDAANPHLIQSARGVGYRFAGT